MTIAKHGNVWRELRCQAKEMCRLSGCPRADIESFDWHPWVNFCTCKFVPAGHYDTCGNRRSALTPEQPSVLGKFKLSVLTRPLISHSKQLSLLPPNFAIACAGTPLLDCLSTPSTRRSSLQPLARSDAHDPAGSPHFGGTPASLDTSLPTISTSTSGRLERLAVHLSGGSSDSGKSDTMSNGKLEDSHGSSHGPFGPIFQLIPGVQSYDWGKLADDGSLVAQYAGATKELDFKCAGDRPYAEVSRMTVLGGGHVGADEVSCSSSGWVHTRRCQVPSLPRQAHLLRHRTGQQNTFHSPLISPDTLRFWAKPSRIASVGPRPACPFSSRS